MPVAPELFFKGNTCFASFSQPVKYFFTGFCIGHIQRQRYRIHDAATGLVEEGWVDVAEMVKRGPWLDDSFEFPVEVTRSA